MIVDALTLLWDSAALTATAVSTNSVDFAATTDKIGVGRDLVGIIVVEVAAEVDTTDETYAFNFIQSANANLSSGDTLLTVPFTNAQATAELILGAKIVVPFPKGRMTKRYGGMSVTIAGTIVTGVTVSAWFAPADYVEQAPQRPGGFAVS